MEQKSKTFLEKAIICTHDPFEGIFELEEIDSSKIEFKELKDEKIVDWGDFTPPKPEELTCFNCGARDNCPWSGDPYNTNGDCLAEK